MGDSRRRSFGAMAGQGGEGWVVPLPALRSLSTSEASAKEVGEVGSRCPVSSQAPKIFLSELPGPIGHGMTFAVIYEKVAAFAIGLYESGVILKIFLFRPEHLLLRLNAVTVEERTPVVDSQGLAYGTGQMRLREHEQRSLASEDEPVLN